MKKIKGRIIKYFIVIVIIFIIINFIPTKYYIMSPGIAQELSPMITVEDGYKGNKGAFLLTAVASQRASVWDYIYIFFVKPEGIELEGIEEQLPPGMDMKKYLDIMLMMMEESKLQAQAVAFKLAGFPVKVQGEGAEIVEVLDTGSAKGILNKGDVIIAIDNKVIEFSTDAVNLIRKHEIGDNISLNVLRGREIKKYELKTIELKNTPGKASLGIMITTKKLNYKFPREVYYDTENIVGPSAGGMFALEIYNQLTNEDITKGKRIAGTGTISIDGSLGKIDGVVQKVLAAKKANAEIFILPYENYEELKNIEDGITLVPVNNINEIIDYLNSY
jgi:Lon-like protease